MRTVATFTDTYLPTVNGVSYTVHTWRRRWKQRGGRMPLVYPAAREYTPERREYPVASAPFPFYRGFRFARPTVPNGLRELHLDVVHTHTPFTLGLAGKRLASIVNAPLVASYHTPAGAYAEYLCETFEGTIQRVADRYERWYFEAADAIIAPSETAAQSLDVNETPVYVVSNGVDTDRFSPASEAAIETFRERYDLPDGPLVGYTGRHGYEKRLHDVLDATEALDVAVVLAGDGPARPALERRAAAREDVYFLGFLDREMLSTFYTALDAFVFPSPVETQGLVALEAIACGTPVVAAAAGGLTEAVTEDETGTHFPPGDIDALRAAISDTLDKTDRLPRGLTAQRRQLSVERSMDALEGVYDSVLGNG